MAELFCLAAYLGSPGDFIKYPGPSSKILDPSGYGVSTGSFKSTSRSFQYAANTGSIDSWEFSLNFILKVAAEV